jgi:hypothetical protein
LVCDLAASAENSKAPAFIAKQDNTLVQPWASLYPTGNLWLNPEFADIDPHAAKCRDKSTRRQGLILLLTPASVGANWFAQHVNRKAMVMALSPRLHFEGTTSPYPKVLDRAVVGDEALRVDEEHAFHRFGLAETLADHAAHELPRDARAAGARAEDDDALIAQLVAAHLARGQNTGERDRARALNVVVEGRQPLV